MTNDQAIRVGDRFLVPVAVTEIDDIEPCYQVQSEGTRWWLNSYQLLASKRIPREIREGDRVRYGAAPARVEFVADPDHLGNVIALIRDASRELFLVPITDLTLDETEAT